MPDAPLTARAVRAALRREASAERAEVARWYFKTGPGEYGEGDRFLGVAATPMRRISREFRDLPLDQVERLLESPWHEDRLMALLILGEAYPRSDPGRQAEIYRLYLARTDRINNWDLVDCSAAEVLGRHLRVRSRRPLHRLARSRNLWERRIAIIATKHWIRDGEVDETLALAEQLVGDREDLIHKAAGWMLRCVGDVDRSRLEAFLGRRADIMPRTMLRYAIEKLPDSLRRRYLAVRGKAGPRPPSGPRRTMPTSRTIVSALLAALSLLSGRVASGQTGHFDVLIRHGRILDGTGNPWFPADIGIRGDRIAAIGQLSDATATRVIDARGQYVTPGFIGLHEHIEHEILAGRSQVANYTTQGFTTAVIDADGRSTVWPLTAQRDSLRKLGHSLNLVPMVGHGTVRELVMGKTPDQVMRPATTAEIARMQDLVRQGMRDGGFGLSTGLEYAPMRYSDTKELVGLAQAVAEFGGHVQAHMRSQGRYPKWELPSHMDHAVNRQVDWLDAIQEGIEVARRAGVPFWFDHIHAKGPREWGVSKPTVEAIERAWTEGLQIYTNMHSYDGYQETVTLVPRWALARREVPGMSMSDDFPPVDYTGMRENLERNLGDPGRRAMMETDVAYEVDRQGGPEGLLIVDFPDKALVGKTLAEVARDRGLSTFDAVIWLARNGYPDRKGGVGWMMRAVGMVDIEEWMRHDWNGVALDRGWDDRAGCGVYTHPGTNGTSGRLLRMFVFDRGTITLPYAIRSLTSVGAQALGLSDRGILREGTMADVVVFDPATIRSDATYLNPCVMQQGVNFVLVNGQLVVDGGKATSALPGRVLAPERQRVAR